MNPDISPPSRIFLTAEWRHLVMINFEVDPAVLALSIPLGTELDFWEGKTYVSVVGFLFQKTRLAGLPIPFHQNFEEINLRFYVRHRAAEGWRRGVVFIKELVPRRAIAFVARRVYNENYVALPMSHRIDGHGEDIRSVTYSWRLHGRENSLGLVTQGWAEELKSGSLQEFITEHYWGYARQLDGTTMEYAVEHPRWRVWSAASVTFQCDIAALYGAGFVPYLDRPPSSAFLADGSPVKVHKGVKLKL